MENYFHINNYSYLSSLFKRTTGQTLSAYYRGVRLRTARQLAWEGRMSIGEIAEQMGYSSIYVFSRAYKKEFGSSPTEDRVKGDRK